MAINDSQTTRAKSDTTSRPSRRRAPVRCIALTLVAPLAACSGASPVRPSATAPATAQGSAPTTFSLEGEPGSGNGHVLQRSQASGGLTVHLAPNERRRWSFAIAEGTSTYDVLVRYSNSRWGSQEVIQVSVDDVAVGVFEDGNTGEDEEGWNTFTTHRVGAAPLAAGRHTLTLDVSGGDGCVEIDLVTVAPQ